MLGKKYVLRSWHRIFDNIHRLNSDPSLLLPDFISTAQISNRFDRFGLDSNVSAVFGKLWRRRERTELPKWQL